MKNLKVAAVVALVGSLGLPLAVTAQSFAECDQAYNEGLRQAQNDRTSCMSGFFSIFSDCGWVYLDALRQLAEDRQQCKADAAHAREIQLGREAD